MWHVYCLQLASSTYLLNPVFFIHHLSNPGDIVCLNARSHGADRHQDIHARVCTPRALLCALSDRTCYSLKRSQIAANWCVPGCEYFGMVLIGHHVISSEWQTVFFSVFKMTLEGRDRLQGACIPPTRWGLTRVGLPMAPWTSTAKALCRPMLSSNLFGPATPRSQITRMSNR